MSPRIAIHGRDAGQRCDLAARQRAKLWQARRKRRGNDRADAFDRGKKLQTPLQAGVFYRKRRNGGLKAGDQAGLRFELSHEQALRTGLAAASIWFFKAVSPALAACRASTNS